MRLLLVDDERDILMVLGEILEEMGFAVVSAWDGEGAVEIADLYHPDVVLSDFRLPGMDGVTTIQKVREECPDARAILMSGHISAQTRTRAQAERVERIMEKPVAIPDLLEALRGQSHADGRAANGISACRTPQPVAA